MRISTQWLGELVALPDNLDDALLLAGLNVEGREGDNLELEITSNRGDWLSAIGIAREIGALTGARVRPPYIELDESGAALEGRLTVSIENAADCARYRRAFGRGRPNRPVARLDANAFDRVRRAPD